MKKVFKSIRKYLKEGPWRGGGVFFYRRRPDGQLTILLFRRNRRPGKGRFSIPGGKFDRRYDLQLKDSAIRELREETRFRLEEKDIRGEINFRCPGYRWKTLIVEFQDDLSVFDLWGAQDPELSELVEVTLAEAWSLPLTFMMRYTLIKCVMFRSLP